MVAGDSEVEIKMCDGSERQSISKMMLFERRRDCGVKIFVEHDKFYSNLSSIHCCMH